MTFSFADAMQIITDLIDSWMLIWITRSRLCVHDVDSDEKSWGILDQYLREATLAGLDSDDDSLGKQDIFCRCPIREDLR